MSVKTVLQSIGSETKKVFDWLGSPKGQATIAAGEAAVEIAYPPAAGLIALANVGLTEVIKIEALAAAAGAQNGSGAQKSVAVVTAIEPSVLAFAKEHGLPTPTADRVKAASDALVAFANALVAAV
jgi:hypothetical protein